MRPAREEAGFSLVEMLVAAAILSTAFLVFFQLAAVGQRVARSQPDASDLHQRLRTAADLMQRDLLMAGAGFSHGRAAGPLIDYFPPVLPMRSGALRSDPELSYFDDRITVISVLDGSAGARLTMDMPTPAVAVPIDADGPGCPAAGSCGFEEGSRALLVDRSGTGAGFEWFSVTGTAGGLAHGRPNRPFSRTYRAASALVVPVRQRTYYLDTPTRRLMSYDGYQTDVPLAENIVSLRFEYFIDPSPDAAPHPADGTGNCVYEAGSPPVPLLSGGQSLVLAPAAAPILTDGPVCGLGPNRFDGDLLRVRRIRVTIRAQVADRLLRGAGADFLHPGVSPGGESYVPDIAVSFDVTPRNLTPAR